MPAAHYIRHDAGRSVEVFVGPINEVCALVSIYKGAHPACKVKFEQYDHRTDRATVEIEDLPRFLVS